MAGHRLSTSEMVEAARTLFKELVDGGKESDIADIFGWDSDTFAAVKKSMVDEHATALRTRSTEHTYVQYIIDQQRNVQDLSALIRNLDKKQQYNALVGAIRLRSEITDKVLERGVEFGIIERRQAGNGGGGVTINFLGVKLADLPDAKLRDAIASQLGEMDAMIKRFGDSRGIIDMVPGPTHYALPEETGAPVRLSGAPSATTAAASTIRRGGGKKKTSGSKEG